MRYARLGQTDIEVSRICLGTATFGVAPQARDAELMVGAAIDLGITFFDTADVYGHMPTFDRPGAPPAAQREPAELILGRALRGRRDQVVVATKSGEPTGPGPGERGLSRRRVVAQAEESLRRLGTDRIDVYYAHTPDPTTPLEETFLAYDDLVQAGKVRHVALSNHPAWQVAHALWIADATDRPAPVCVQVKYNLVNRTAERELLPACTRFGLSVVPFAPLHGGLLAGTPGLRGVKGDARFGGAGFTDAELGAGEAVQDLADRWGLTAPQVSLAWLLARPAVASVIVGAENLEELSANASAADVALEDSQVDALSALTAGDV
jgi:aryl-alcohol dehydrogenase-like predicted oxidoreductase